MSVWDTVKGEVLGWFDYDQPATTQKAGGTSTPATGGAWAGNSIPVPTSKPTLNVTGSQNGILDVFNDIVNTAGGLASKGLDIYERFEAAKEIQRDSEFARQTQAASNPDAYLFSNKAGGFPIFWVIIAGVVGIALLARGD